MAVLSFVALAGITESLHPVLQKSIRGDMLKLIAQNSALVKTHNKKLSIDMIFFRLRVFLAIKGNNMSLSEGLHIFLCRERGGLVRFGYRSEGTLYHEHLETFPGAMPTVNSDCTECSLSSHSFFC